MKTREVEKQNKPKWARALRRFAVVFTVAASMFAFTPCNLAGAAGLLKPLTGGDNAIQIRSHRVGVVINNGFAKTEVEQVFSNTSDRDLEAIYTFPLPKKASLSELSLLIDGNEILGEVVEKEQAKKIYEDQKAQGNDTALAEKDDFKTFNVHVGNVRARMDARVRLVYYQPLEIDLNVGRYVYPLAEGNVDEERIAFWSVDDAVKESFAFDLELKSAFPVKDVRVPGFEDKAVIGKTDDAEDPSTTGGGYRVTIENAEGFNLSKDIVFYYRLDDTVPARLELIPYREDPQKPGTFMVVVTPAASLQRISEGVDWMFVLDNSGSMEGRKIATLLSGVTHVLKKMSSNDRFGIVTFNSQAYDVTGGYVQATPENIQAVVQKLNGIRASGSTALFEGLETAYKLLDADRTSGIILVTDGVCNVGPTQHADFLNLMKQHDVRLFTFVIGNSANQPLMDRLARDSGGFAMNISEGDDMTGRLIQAKAKVLHECLYDVELKFHGEKVKEVTPSKPGNLYMGQQLVVFGRYTGHGDVDVELKARISGQDQSWRCKAVLPESDVDNPEVERLWALSNIEDQMEVIREKGETDALRTKVAELGKEYSLVTDYTSMLVVREDIMESEHIERKNAQRVSRERQAQSVRSNMPAKSYRVDQSSEQGGMFRGAKAPNIGSGPVGPLFGAVAAWLLHRKRKARKEDRSAL